MPSHDNLQVTCQSAWWSPLIAEGEEGRTVYKCAGRSPPGWRRKKAAQPINLWMEVLQDGGREIWIALSEAEVACCYITLFSVTLSFTQDSLVGASLGMDHWMDNSFLESCRIEGVHFWIWLMFLDASLGLREYVVLEGWRAAITMGTNDGPLTRLSNR